MDATKPNDVPTTWPHSHCPAKRFSDNSPIHTSYWPTGQEKATWGSQTNPTVKLYSPQGELIELRTYRSSNLSLAPDETTTGYDATTWTYNPRGEITQKTYADGKGPSYTYSPATLRQTSETIAYDLNTDGTPELTRTLNRSTDSLGRSTGYGLTNGNITEAQASYQYDAATGRLSTVSDGTNPFTYNYLANSNLIESVTGPAHSVTNAYATDRDVLLTKENKVGSTAISQYDYSVNAIGQRSAVSQTGTAFPAARQIAWQYDSLGQVIEANSTDNSADRTYQYDSIGNRLKSASTLTLPTTPNYTSNNLNQYTAVGSVTPIHDDDGNLTSGQVPAGAAGLIWDAENRLSTATVNGTTVHYTYDSQSRRIAKSANGSNTTFVYDGWNVIAEYTSSGSPLALSKTYLWGLDLSGSMQGAGGVGGLLSVCQFPLPLGEGQGEGQSTVFYPCFDGNGNISEYLDATGATTAHFEYDPFGNTVVNTDTVEQFEYRFSTKPLDPITGLYYYGYRWYEPLTGRWPSRDPIEEEGGMNLYGFVGNDGVDLVDGFGLKFTTIVKPVEPGSIDKNRPNLMGDTRETKNVPSMHVDKNGKDSIVEYPSPLKGDKDKCCAQILSVTDWELEVTSLIPNKPPSGYSNKAYQFVIGHEHRRRIVYELAYNAYLVQIKEQTLGKLQCCENPGVAKANLVKFFNDVYNEYVNLYNNYVSTNQAAISSEMKTLVPVSIPAPKPHKLVAKLRECNEK